MNFFRLTKLSLSTINLCITNSIPVKKYSLGAVYRIKNAESTIELAIRSIIDILDEVVIVDNASSDNTKKIILKLKSEYGEKIKIFQYENELCRAWVGYQECLKKNKDGSLADYYNFSFSKSTTDYILKCDANYIYTKAGKYSIVNALNSGYDVICFPGVEIFGHHHSYEPFLFKRDSKWIFIDDDMWESIKFNKKVLTHHIILPCFIHVKRLNYIKFYGEAISGVEGLYAKCSKKNH